MNRDSVSLPHAKIGEIYKHIELPPKGLHCVRKSFWTHTNLFIMVLDVQWDPANFGWCMYDVLRWHFDKVTKSVTETANYTSRLATLHSSGWELYAETQNEK